MSRRIRSTLLAAFLLSLALALADASSASAGWKMSSADYFTGSTLDRSRWSVYNGPGNAGMGVRRPSQVTVAGGNLIITAGMVGGVLRSGGLAHRTNLPYGRFEFVVRTEADPSAATSATVLTWPQSGNMLRDGENDIYETGSYADRNPFYSFIHFGSRQYNVMHWADATQWHKMVLEWEPDAMRIYRDGTLIRAISDARHIPDSRHHLAIQLDAVRRSMSGTVRMYVQYVRFYRPA